jgi:hypothetical protein
MAKSMKLGGGGRFAALEHKLSGKVHNPGAVAAKIGMEKYGKAKMEKMAEHGKQRAAHKSSKRVG